MPNYCRYTMYAEGKPDSIDELIARMTTADGERPHFWRIFEAQVEDLEPRTESARLVCISGECAWSVQACMTDGGYAEEHAKDPEVAPYCTSLKKTADEFDIEIEVFSEEPSMEFAEHLHYIPNDCPIEDECDFEEVWWDRDEYVTFEELDDVYDLTARGITEKDFADGDYVEIGGFWDLTPFCCQKAADEGEDLDVELTDVGSNRVSVVVAVRAITGCDLKEASDTVRCAPTTILKGASKEEADAAKKQLEAAGATVTLI